MSALLMSRKAERQVASTMAQQRQTILLASDGTAAANAATRVASAIARTQDAEVRVLSVLPPQLYPPALSDGGIAAPIGDLSLEYDTEGRRRSIRDQIAETGFDPAEWPLDLQVGPPALIISREARRQGVSLVAMGLRHHGAVDRLLRDETTLRVVRESPVPVLAVTSAATGLPRRLAVAVDFSRASLRAARTAIRLLGPDSSVFVVYVGPEMDRSEEHEGAGVIHTQGIIAAFARLRRELMVPTDVRIEAVMLKGQPAAELLSFADRADIDLIAVGSHRHPFLSRLLVGSVTSTLVRDARRSLLVSPPSPPKEE